MLLLLLLPLAISCYSLLLSSTLLLLFRSHFFTLGHPMALPYREARVKRKATRAGQMHWFHKKSDRIVRRANWRPLIRRPSQRSLSGLKSWNLSMRNARERWGMLTLHTSTGYKHLIHLLVPFLPSIFANSMPGCFRPSERCYYWC